MICDFCDATTDAVEMSGNNLHCCTECFKSLLYQHLSEKGKENYDRPRAENAILFNGLDSLNKIKDCYVLDSDNRIETTAGKPKIFLGDVIFTVDKKVFIYPKEEFLKKFRWSGRMF